MDIHESHVYITVIIDDVGRSILVLILYLCIEDRDDRHQLRNNLVHKVEVPGLKSLSEDRMVRVSTGLCHDVASLIYIDSSLCQKSDKLRDYHRRMRVVYLDSRIVCEVMEVRSSGDALVYDKLCSGAYHEVLLIDTEHSALVIRIIRI